MFLVLRVANINEHADKLREYLNKRGGTIRLDGTVLTSIVKSLNGSQAMQVALDTERHVNEALLKLHNGPFARPQKLPND